MAATPPATPLLRLPIGVSDFRELREPGVIYVDKTGFVTEVLASRRKVILVPRPRRFGKTVNLSTLRCFVEKVGDERQHGTALFEGLAVWGSAEARRHFQRYPVISLTFKDVKAPDFDAALAQIRGEIRRAHEPHACLLDAGALRQAQAARFEEILRGEGPETLYAESLLELSAHLARYHGERVFILIDEYDTPVHAARTPEDAQRMLDFLRAFFSGGLKDNRHLQKGVLTGVLRIAKESLFSGLNNLAVYSLLRGECATSFGFTEAEVRDLAARTGNEAALPDLEAWYNGYRFGGHVVYNPWSVLSYLDSEDKVLRPYWVNTSSDDLLRRIVLMHGLGRHGEIETLLSGGDIQKAVDDGVALRDVDSRPETVWGFLLFTGYLKATEVRVEEGQTIARLAIPNKEVHYVYRNIFQAWLEQRLGDEAQVDALTTAILQGDGATLKRLLNQFLESLSVHDLAPRRAPKKRGTAGEGGVEPEIVLAPEQAYHVFMVGLLLHLTPKFIVRSNREAGSGRYDLMILPRSPGQPGAVLELKVKNARSRATAKSALAAAMKQMRTRDYAAVHDGAPDRFQRPPPQAPELHVCGASPIHEIGVVFEGKRAHVAVAGAALRASVRATRG